MATDHAARSDQAGPEPSPESWWVPVIAYQDDIAFEIDQVAIRSAECEMHVREVLVSLAGDHDRSWILFEGQGQRGSMPMNVDTTDEDHAVAALRPGPPRRKITNYRWES